MAILVASAQAKDAAPRPPRPPNVVLIAIDTLRSDHLGCYGYERATSPNIDRLASDGVLFEQCYSVASWTLPSFMSMFTGLMPAVHGCTETGNKLSSAIPTLPERFKERGYFCGGVISNYCMYGKYGFGRGFDIYDDKSVFMDAESGVFKLGGKADATDINDVVTGRTVNNVANLLIDKARKSGKPFFLFIHYFDPHDSYVPPHPYNQQFDPDYKGQLDGRGLPAKRNHPPTGRDLEHLVALYDGEIAFTDHLVGEICRKLEAGGGAADTLTILVSDHGEAFGEHGMLLHGNSAFREEIQVPMIWRWPGVLPKGHRVKSPVCTMDLTITLKELMRFKNFSILQGRSLWPALLGRQLPPDAPVFSQRARLSGHHVAMTQDHFRLHAWFDKRPNKGKFQLYDLAVDPWEKRSVLAEHAARVTQMKGTIDDAWWESMDVRLHYLSKSGDEDLKLTEEQIRHLKTMGYISGSGK